MPPDEPDPHTPGRAGSDHGFVHFQSAAAAASALNTYGTFFAFTQAHGSDEVGWTARRHGGQGEWVHVVTAGPELYAWTGATRESVLVRRVNALGPVAEEQATAKRSRLSDPSHRQVSNRLAASPMVIVGIVSLNLFAAVGWFFKGSAWAARVDPVQLAKPAPAESVARDVLALNHSEHPTNVTRETDGAIEINWRYADARWWDLMRVHQMKRTHRLVLHFDETTHTVRVREYWSAFDASAGADGLRLNWKMNTGIQFFSIEHKRVFGVQLAPDGQPTGQLSKAYTFDLQSLKSPVIDVVIRSGWRWQPVTWNAPAPLRWLTE